MKKIIRILQIVPNINITSGVFQVVLNWHRNIDISKIQFDYLYFSNNLLTSQEKEIEKLGGKCFYLSYKNPFRFICNLIKIFKENKYTIIHSHILQLPIIIFPIAKICGVKNIIQHAHSTKWSNNKLKAIRNYLMLHSVWLLITKRLACSKKAGKIFFGTNFEVINNTIDVNKFAYNEKTRKIKRKKLGIDTDFVIGHVGRLNPEKNHIFLIEVFEEVIKINPNSKLVLVGSGPLEVKLKQIVKEKNLEHKVLFLGPRNDVAELLQAFDCFVFPSLFEGLGIVAIEAQAAGLPCILADTLPKEAFICNYKKLPLGDVNKWAKEIISFTKGFTRKDTYNAIKKAGFYIKDIAKQIQNFYIDLF